MDFIKKLFSADGFMPHGHCYLWIPSLVWLHVISDSLIALAYFTIPVTLIYIARKRKDLPFDWMFMCFSAFILCCGTTHLLEVWTLWHATYWLSGTVKAITAVVSIATAILLVRLIPKLLAIPNPQTLKQINSDLLQEINKRKQVQEELLWKTAFLEAQVNSSIEGLLVVDPQSRKLLQNQRFTDLLKIPRHIAEDKDDEEQLRWVTDMMKHPGPFVEKVVYLYSHPDEICRDEIELKDGTILDRYSSPVAGKDGKYYGRIWTFRDITESKRGEQEIRFNERRYRSLVEATAAIVWDTPASGEFEVAQPAWSKFTGQSFEELRGWGWLNAIHLDDRAETARVWSAAVADRTGYAVEHRLRARDQTYRNMQVRAVPILAEDGAIRQWIGVHTDITERKQAEAALRLLNSAVEQSKEAIMITDAELDLPGPRIIFVNSAFTQMTGYTSAELAGKTPRIFQGPRTDRSVLQRLRHNLGRGENFAGEAINYRKDGTEFFLEWQVAPIRDAGGKITHFVAVEHDITERKQIEARLFQSQKMETVGKLAGGIAHEFNSILTAILGQSELLLGDLPAGNPLVKNATEINKAAGRAATLTRQLLAYGRKQFLQTEILDLNRVVAGMEEMLKHLVGVDVDVRIVPDLDLQPVQADAGQIEQVIMNLAVNARDAMPRGGKLTLETATVTLDAEYVSHFPESEVKAGDYVMLAISDTGTGMGDAVKARLFEPFFSTKGVGQGTGLGLSTCYGIVKQSGGHISAYSEPGRGTTFKIYLPQVERQKPPAAALAPPELPRGTENILLVEDDPALREMAGGLLRRLGYMVFTAANGVEALSLKQELATGHIDLLFTDVVMPHMSGRELADRVQALSPHTKILFTSAYAENAIAHQGVLNPGVALLQKPFTPLALARKIREALDGPKA
jgi:PAS domain S-box-containing protein